MFGSGSIRDKRKRKKERERERVVFICIQSMI
jgi:hypothetical protein